MSTLSARSSSSSATTSSAPATTRTSPAGIPSVPALTSSRTTTSYTPSSSVSVRQSPSPSPSPSSLSNGALIGLIAGGVTFAILLAVATIFIIRRRSNGRRGKGGRGSAYGAQMFRQRSRKVVAMPEDAYRWNATNASTSDLYRGGGGPTSLAPSTARHSSSGVSLGYVNGPGPITPHEDDSHMTITPNGRNGNISYFTSLGLGKPESNPNERSGIAALTGVLHFSVSAQDPAPFVLDSMRPGRHQGAQYVDSPKQGVTGLAKSYGASQFDYPSPILSQRAGDATSYAYSDSPNMGKTSRPTTPTKTFGANHFDLSSPNVQVAYPTYTGSPSISRPDVTTGTDQIERPPKNSNPLSSFPTYGVSTMQRQGSRPTTPTKTFGANQFDTATPYGSQYPTATGRQSNSHPTTPTKTFGANQFDSPSPFLAQNPLPDQPSRPFQDTRMKYTESPVLLQMPPPGKNQRELAGASQFDAPSPYLSQRSAPENSSTTWSRPIVDSPSLSSRYPPGSAAGVAPSGQVRLGGQYAATSPALGSMGRLSPT
ncbi:hypothetical protein BJ742DRAFT_773337 [Cladochytrium replicatum]|nr:hypothetical protein BJ742DRAFT_773337 [Cladochytrium replicatum]